MECTKGEDYSMVSTGSLRGCENPVSIFLYWGGKPALCGIIMCSRSLEMNEEAQWMYLSYRLILECSRNKGGYFMKISKIRNKKQSFRASLVVKGGRSLEDVLRVSSIGAVIRKGKQ